MYNVIESTAYAFTMQLQLSMHTTEYFISGFYVMLFHTLECAFFWPFFYFIFSQQHFVFRCAYLQVTQIK